jgi:hypothetical protein
MVDEVDFSSRLHLFFQAIFQDALARSVHFADEQAGR